MSHTLAPELERALRRLDATLGLRPERDMDANFIVQLYTQTRWAELAPVPWPELSKFEFLAQQCAQQHKHYVHNYPNADLLIVEKNGRLPIGRVYVHATAAEIRLMDIALLDSEQGRGIGSATIVALQVLASQRRIDLTLHVEPNNPAQRLYRRLGFALVEHRGVYDFLKSSPPHTQLAATAQLNTASN